LFENLKCNFLFLFPRFLLLSSFLFFFLTNCDKVKHKQKCKK
jgi:hypothetical protein